VENVTQVCNPVIAGFTGVFGKVVMPSPAQHPGRGQPEAGYNGPPPLVWVLSQPSVVGPRWCLGSN
jgi:hypothetical protein